MVLSSLWPFEAQVYLALRLSLGDRSDLLQLKHKNYALHGLQSCPLASNVMPQERRIRSRVLLDRHSPAVTAPARFTGPPPQEVNV